MKPYWHNEAISLFLGDMREVLPSLNRTFSLCLTDPPYGIYTEKTGTGFILERVDSKLGAWDERISPEHFDAMFDHSENQVFWGMQYYLDMLPPTKEVWVWDKQTGNNHFADGELAWTSYDGTLRIFRHQWCGCFKDSERNVSPIHPTQKPVQLMQWCMRHEDQNATVIDPLCGSGSTLVAAHHLNIQATGIEANEEYCERTAKRLQAITAQQLLPL